MNKNGIICQSGLFSGSMGMVLVDLIKAKSAPGDTHFYESGMDKLNDIGASLENMFGDTSFASGLTGIGWAIEWAVQHELLRDTNTDEVLFDIDDVLYRKIMYSKEADMSLHTGILGKVKYFSLRTKSVNPDSNRFRHLVNKECLVALTDDLLQRMNNSVDLPLLDICAILSVIHLLVPINKPTTEKILKEAYRISWNILTNPDNSSDTQQRKLYLCFWWLIVARDLKNELWKNQFNFFVQQNSVFNVNFSPLKTMESLIVNLLFSILLPDTGYGLSARNNLKELSKNSYQNSLYRGIGTIEIASIAIEQPNLLNGWQDIFFI